MRPSCHFIASIIAVALALSPIPAQAQPVDWVKYRVPQTGTSVDIPTSIFSEEAGEPAEGRGGRFVTSDRRADLTVQSVTNNAGLSPAAYLASKNPPRDIVYKRMAPRFFVVSGFHKGQIWYDRCNFAGRLIHCVLVNYPAAEKRQWDGIITRISNSLASR